MTDLRARDARADEDVCPKVHSPQRPDLHGQQILGFAEDAYQLFAEERVERLSLMLLDFDGAIKFARRFHFVLPGLVSSVFSVHNLPCLARFVAIVAV